MIEISWLWLPLIITIILLLLAKSFENKKEVGFFDYI